MYDCSADLERLTQQSIHHFQVAYESALRIKLEKRFYLPALPVGDIQLVTIKLSQFLKHCQVAFGPCPSAKFMSNIQVFASSGAGAACG